MLTDYYIRPATVDRIQASWISPAIEEYVDWLKEHDYTARSVLHRVPVLTRFGEFAKEHGATEMNHLPDHVEPFVQKWIQERAGSKGSIRRKKIGQEVRNPIQQMLRLMTPDYTDLGRPHKPDNPFERQAPQFLVFLSEEKGLHPRTILQYRFHLRQFATYLERVGIDNLTMLSPIIINGFITEFGSRVAWTTLRNACGTLRVLLRYLHREKVLAKDLSSFVEFPQSYRLAGIPRSIGLDQVELVLTAVDRRSVCGKRDYAMLLLLAVYGLRACEVASLTLDDIDWRNERMHIRERKSGNTTTYPLSKIVGEAIVDYLQKGRPATTHREIFLRSIAPLTPISHAAVVSRAAHFIRAAGVDVPRPGSHVLRHSCVQRLLDAHFPLKHIGDYVGHRSASSTQIYGKIAIEELRELAQGDGEEVL